MFNSCRHARSLLVILIGLAAWPVHSVETKATANTNSPSSGIQGGGLLEQYRSVIRQADVLTIYNQHIKDQVNAQIKEKSSLEKQLKDIEATQQKIVPLILRMLDSLDKFVQMDLPFLLSKHQLVQVKEFSQRRAAQNSIINDNMDLR